MKLPSGAELKVTLSPFAISRDLYQSILEEAKGLRLDPKSEVDVNLFKDIFCSALSSKKIESCTWECLKRATYNGLKVDGDTFEKEEARQDYIPACYEVARANVMPFMKGLSAEFSPILEQVKNSLGSRPLTT